MKSALSPEQAVLAVARGGTASIPCSARGSIVPVSLSLIGGAFFGVPVAGLVLGTEVGAWELSMHVFVWGVAILSFGLLTVIPFQAISRAVRRYRLVLTAEGFETADRRGAHDESIVRWREIERFEMVVAYTSGLIPDIECVLTPERAARGRMRISRIPMRMYTLGLAIKQAQLLRILAAVHCWALQNPRQIPDG